LLRTHWLYQPGAESSITFSRSAAGGDQHQRREGESWTEGKDVTHWAENKGNEPTVVIAVDVFKP